MAKDYNEIMKDAGRKLSNSALIRKLRKEGNRPGALLLLEHEWKRRDIIPRDGGWPEGAGQCDGWGCPACQHLGWTYDRNRKCANPHCNQTEPLGYLLL